MWKITPVIESVCRIRWQGKQITLQGSHSTTPSINVNRKRHNLTAASELLHVISNWRGLGLGEVKETVMETPDNNPFIFSFSATKMNRKGFSAT